MITMIYKILNEIYNKKMIRKIRILKIFIYYKNHN